MLIETLLKYSSFFLYKVDKDKLRIMLESSPYYPSLLSILHTLRSVGLDIHVGQCDMEYLKTINTPVLLHLIIDKNEYVVLSKWQKNKKRILCYSPEKHKWESHETDYIGQVWDGVTMYCENKTIPKWNININIIGCIITSIIVLSIIILIGTKMSFVALPIIIGMLISISLYNEDLFSQIYILDRVCHISSTSDCNKVSSSVYSRIAGFKLSEMSLSYFTAQMIMLYLVYIFNQVEIFGSLYFISLLVILPISIYSGYCQYKIKSYCPLCITSLICILCEAIIFISTQGDSLSLDIMISFCIIFIAILCILRFISFLRSKSSDYISNKIGLLTLKRKNTIFMLESHESGNINSPIYLGIEDSNVIVTTIISPSCKHCKKIAKELIPLLNTNIQFRWNIIWGSVNMSDEKRICSWIALFMQNKGLFIKELSKWSNGKDSILNMELDNINDDQVLHIKEYFNDCISKMEIIKFPQTSINNRLLSSIYTPQDYQYLILDNTRI